MAKAKIVYIISQNFLHKMSDKMAYANSADPDQIVPEGNSLSLHC